MLQSLLLNTSIMKLNKDLLINLIPSLIVMTIIFISSSTPGQVINETAFGSPKLQISGHYFIFTLLCIAFYKAVKDISLSIYLSIFYAIIDEIHQSFVPMRSASLFDIFTDTFGILVAGLILWKLQHFLPKKLKIWLNN